MWVFLVSLVNIYKELMGGSPLMLQNHRFLPEEVTVGTASLDRTPEYLVPTKAQWRHLV